ncbi:MAG: hypothetical protein EXX96DRAFT_576291 [Benjaminiella poitrasii]|nr:MAG: hypothetical protein EXX96DRAFT_576291 [Benjaminiella poitrasii]
MSEANTAIPIIDFSDYETNPKRIAKEVFNACKTIGFFYMKNHGLPQDDIDHAFELSKGFFDLPKEEKRKYLIKQNNHGYSELYSETLDPKHQKQGDHKEGFNFRSFVNGKPYAPLPQVFDKQTEFLAKFSKSCHEVALRILEIFAIALEIPEEKNGRAFFANKHDYDTSAEILRFLKYPRGGEAEYKEPVRAGAHSDYGSITLLFQKDVPGLEVLKSAQEWTQAPLIEDAIIVNVGDQMEIWTNGLFKSTKHRVIFLPEHRHMDRYSIPYFVHPCDEVPLSPVPSRYVKCTEESRTANHCMTAGEHLRSRLDATYDYKN